MKGTEKATKIVNSRLTNVPKAVPLSVMTSDMYIQTIGP
jgi:hypothetical protein